jgi:hypothetical protein
VPPIEIVLPLTGLAAQHEETPSPIAKPAPGNKSAAKVAIWPAIATLQHAIDPLARAVVTAPEGGRVRAIVLEEGATVLAVVISRAAVAAIATLLVEARVVLAATTERARAPAAVAAHLAWDREAAEAGAAAVDGVGRIYVGRDMNARFEIRILWLAAAVIYALLSVPPLTGQDPGTNAASPNASPARTTSVATASSPKATTVSAAPKTFDNPEQAANALVDAAEKFDVRALEEIFGPDGDDIVLSGEYPQDRKRATDFAAEAREKKSISLDPKTGSRAFLLVSDEDWPFPVPLVKVNGKWLFDAKAGRQELLYRRIGSNELDAIDICHGYVEAQYDYAFRKRDEYDVNQYAQRIISTPGQQNGLAWQNPDGTWGGPIGETIARAIEQGYSGNAEPYHGYFFKILKGQGPAAPLGEMDYVVKGVMIGGFALVAAPAEYGETGVKTFIVSQDGVVYEKDFGPASLSEFIKMERFNPDKTWIPVPPDID